jgi:hypothetical protein
MLCPGKHLYSMPCPGKRLFSMPCPGKRLLVRAACQHVYRSATEYGAPHSAHRPLYTMPCHGLVVARNANVCWPGRMKHAIHIPSYLSPDLGAHAWYAGHRFNTTGLFTLAITSAGSPLGSPFGPIKVLPPPPDDSELAPSPNLEPSYCEHGEVTCSEHGVQDGCACTCFEGFTTDWTVVVGGCGGWWGCVLQLAWDHCC